MSVNQRRDQIIAEARAIHEELQWLGVDAVVDRSASSGNQGIQLVTARFDDVLHILVAGETGSGKSVLLRNLVTSLANAISPADLRIAIIDLKNTS